MRAPIGTFISNSGNSAIDLAAQPSEGSIRAAVAMAVAIGGACRIWIGDAGTTGITLTAPLPLISGITYIGVAPKMTHTGNVPDNDFAFVGGTWFKGDNTFKCFQAQSSAYAALDTDLASPDANFTTNAIRECGLINIGIGGGNNLGFTVGISLGAKNQAGALYSWFQNIYIRDCLGATQTYSATCWGALFQNCQHCHFEGVWSYNNANGVFFSSSVANTVLQCGNFVCESIYHNPGTVMSAADRRKSRGIVFVGQYDGYLNQVQGFRLQVNRFNMTQASETSTITSGSSNVQVADSSIYQVGMPVVFTTQRGDGSSSTNTIFANRVYIVKSLVNATNITVANSRDGTVITPNASGTSVLKTWGMPNIEVYGDRVTGGATASKVSNCHMTGIDIEGDSSAQLYLDRVEGSMFDVTQLGNSTAAIHPHFVVRNSQPNIIRCQNTYISDVDGSSTQCQFYGTRNAGSSLQQTGQFFGRNSSSGAFELGIGSADLSVRSANLQQREPSGGQFMYPLSAIGQRVNGDRGGGAFGLNPGTAGLGRYTGSGATATLGTLSADNGTSAGGSLVGCHFFWCNNGSGALTIATASGQPFNGVSTLESIVLPAPVSGQVSWLECWGCQNSSGGSTFYWMARWGGLVFKNTTLSFASDANKTLTATEAMFENIVLSGGSTLTATRDVIVPHAPGKVWIITNSTTGAQSIRVIGASGTGITIANARSAIVRSDGTNIVRVTADSVLT